MKHTIDIKTVAQAANVSISTVSRVLNHSANVSPALRERVCRAIEETGYSVNPIASTLKSARRNQIAILLPSLRQTYFTDIIKGAGDYCYDRGVMPLILESDGDPEKERQLVEQLEKQWVDGILFLPSNNLDTPGYGEFLESLHSLRKQGTRIPVVLAECCGLGQSLDCVRTDYEETFYRLTAHLLETGRRRLAYLTGPVCSPLYGVCRDAFARALGDWGLVPDEARIEPSGDTILDGCRAMARVLGRDKTIDGVVCCGDQVAAGALCACRERGAAGKIAVAGFGGVAMSILTTPSITTAIAPRYDIGRTAAELLFMRITGSTRPPEERILPSHLALRASTLPTAAKDLETMFAE